MADLSAKAARQFAIESSESIEPVLLQIYISASKGAFNTTYIGLLSDAQIFKLYELGYKIFNDESIQPKCGCAYKIKW